MRPSTGVFHAPRSQEQILATATMRAAEAMGLSGRELAEVLGVSPATISRLRGADDDAAPLRKRHVREAALMLVRIYRSLCGLVGRQPDHVRKWLGAENSYLHGVPKALIMTNAEGRVRCADYLDALRGQ